MEEAPTRRTVLGTLGAGFAGAALVPWPAWAESSPVLTKKIPSSGEALPVVGMGTWQTFNVGEDPVLRDARTKVLKAFFELGGGMVDTSPMYGSAQAVLGYALKKLGVSKSLFSADKVWTSDGDKTRAQVARSEELWGLSRIDLMQVHNLVAWKAHLPTLKRMKALRYVGITTSHGRRHADLEKVMKNEQLDFVQLTYNVTHRSVEERLLPLAKERGIAVIVNRPFGGGGLIGRVQQHPLPSWAKQEADCANWPEFLLKYIVSHPAVTVAIPATTKVEHMRENMGAARGELPDAKTRRKMEQYVASL